jgi:signal transduction histidine kinase
MVWHYAGALLDVHGTGPGDRDRGARGGVTLLTRFIDEAVAACGGRLDVRSTVGQGSAFTLTLRHSA